MIITKSKYYCDICKKEVERFAEPKKSIPCLKIREYQNEDNFKTLDICQNCNDRLYNYIKGANKNGRG